ncbi:MAG: hypothetical protein ABI388_03090 [Bacteroidia bacterium]
MLTITVKAQTSTFNPFQKENYAIYHLDFTQYFVNDNEEKKDLQKLYASLKKFSLFKGKTTLSAANLIAVLKMQDSLLIQFYRHYIYHYLLASVNRKNIQSRELSKKMEADFNEKTSFLEKELTGLSPSKLTNYIQQKPEIKKYDYYFKKILRNKEHQVSPSIEETINHLTPSLSAWQFELYQTIGDNIKFEDIETPNGKLNAKKESKLLQTNSDSSIRQKGFKKLYEGFNSMRDLYAFTLIKLANAANENALLHHFSDAAEMYYFDKFQTKVTINNILLQITDSVSVYKHYQQIKSDLKKQKLLTPQINYWDLDFSPNLKQPQFTIDSAQQIILAALQPLGEEYHKELFNLLNPVNRRMEIYPDKNKRSGGFSMGFIGTNSVFFTGGYLGYYNDVRVLVHESTHAIHRQLMNANNVLPVFADGPNYLFESFAIFSEFLFSDYLIQQAKTKEEKQYYLEQYFDNKGMIMFSVASDALLEQNIHDGIKAGIINTADDLDSLNKKINETFSIWNTEQLPQLNQRWITARLFYEDPFYEINYVLGAMLALKYYELYTANKDLFCKNYIALLKNGFTADAQTLLKKYLDIDINNPSNLVKDAIKITNLKVNQLEELYNK